MWNIRFLLIVALAANCHAQSVASQCLQDLDAIPGFLLANDTGAKDHVAKFGQRHFDDALALARNSARQATTSDACDTAIRQYLQAWRHGHLELQPLSPQAAKPETTAAPKRDDTPTLAILSAKTLVLTLKSFRDANRDPLVALIKKNHAVLASRRNWIIDVRGNGGGSDSSYLPLLPWLMTDEMVDAGQEILATPENIIGWERFCDILSPGDKVCKEFEDRGIARMRKAAPGQYVPQDDVGRITFERVKGLEPRRPTRVAILIDHGCGSSCEELVLAARQSFQVKLIGRSTYGSLDYSNVRPHELPSGQRRLWYATTRSNRIPDLPVDLSGIQPDIYLPVDTNNPRAKEDEVKRVQNWLEGGSIAPLKGTLPVVIAR